MSHGPRINLFAVTLCREPGKNRFVPTAQQWSLRLYIFSLFLQRYQHVYLMYYLLTSLSATSQPSQQAEESPSYTWPLEAVRAWGEQGPLGAEEGVEHPRTWASRASSGLSPRRISPYKQLSWVRESFGHPACGRVWQIIGAVVQSGGRKAPSANKCP